jgi:hypothetical protein
LHKVQKNDILINILALGRFEMAGVFGFFDFTKPGKGVSADEPQKRAFFRYFILLGRNLWNFVLLNLMYFVCVLPLVLYFHVSFFDPLLFELSAATELSQTMYPLVIFFSFLFSMPVPLQVILLILSILVQGPLTCGFAYCLRNAVREEHFWRSDLWTRARKNLRQGVALGLLDFVVIWLGLASLYLFASSFSDMPGYVRVFTVLSLLLFVLYLAMRGTLYTMAVTIELTMPQLLRNALIFVLAGLPRFLLTALLTGLIAALTMAFGLAELIVLPLIGFALLGYTVMFITYPLVDKFLVRPRLENESEDRKV